MSDPRMDRIQKLFDAAAELSAAERSAFLDRESGDDVGLRRQLDAMLGHLDRSETLAPPVLDAAGVQAPEGPGSQIDRYKLLQRIGEGGFGVVYMAEQTHPVVRKVALKIIKLGMDTREVIARFEAERQALAMMDHPNIAKVLDGGATDTGRPYFVMELVRGVPITEYCDANKLDTRSRLRLFQRVCHAVQHAHQKGVIHRDLKPSNVMVTLNDGEPIPKVIDFGIVKAMHTKLTEKTLFTEYQRFLGTPAYMSPEQAEMSALDVDTRTDIYSLGVLLYELLTGSTPLDTAELLREGMGAVQRSIAEVVPPRPSMRISTEGTAAIASQRGGDVAELSKRLRGDLDWIAMKALEKERARRYSSASEFAADIQRHLDSEPVLAGPPSASYRLRKYVRRHRAAVTAAAVILIVLLGGILGTSIGMVEAARQRDAAEDQARHAMVALDFLVETLALTDPVVALDPGVSMRMVLDQAAATVSTAFREQPEAEARVRGTIGRAYASIGEHRLADANLRRSVQLIDSVPDYDPADLYTILWETTHVAFRLDRDDAFAWARRAHDVALELISVEHRALAQLVDDFAVAIDRQRMDDAIELFRDSVAEAERALGNGDPLWPVLADRYMAGGFSLWYGPNEAVTEEFYRKALEIRRREREPNHPEIGEALSQLVGVLNRSGRAVEAEQYIRDSLQVLRGVFDEDHWQLAFARSVLGDNLVQQGRYAEAENLLVGAHEVLDAWDPDGFYATDSLVRILALYDGWQKLEEAVPYRQRFGQIAATYKWLNPWVMVRGAFDPSNKELLEILDRMFEICGDVPFATKGSVMPAEDIGPLLDRLIELRKETLPDDDAQAALVARLLLGWANALAPEPERAHGPRMVNEALAILRSWEEHLALEIADALAQRSRQALAEDDRGRATQLAREAIGLLRQSRAGDAWYVVMAQVRVARSLVALELFEEAEGILLPSYQVFESQLGLTHADALEARRLLFELYTSWGKPEKAMEFRSAR